MPLYFTKPEVVAQNLQLLRGHSIHPNFAGYLAIKRTLAALEHEGNIHVNFKEFFDTFLRVPDASNKKPYMMPFCESGPSEANKWYNSNPPGSYAPSSIRTNSRFDMVVSAKGDGRKPTYSLRDKHWELAYKHLALGKKIPVVPLSIVLYRDFALQVDNPTTRDIVDIFRDEFGYRDYHTTEFDTEFNYLYFDDSDSEAHPEWFEVANG